MIDEKEFSRLVEKWEEHCIRNATSSIMRSYIECDADKRMVEIGPEVLPLLASRYRNKDVNDKSVPGGCFVGFSLLVSEIDPRYETIPEEIRGNIRELHSHATEWIDDNIK